MPLADLAMQTASLLRLSTANEDQSLHRLAAMAARQVVGCMAAGMTLWNEGELANLAASHPDANRLVQVQLDSGRGPLLEALDKRVPVHCTDTRTELRWPEYATAALRLGVRCSVTLCAGDQVVVAFSLLGARPAALDLEQVQLAEFVAAYSAAVVGAVSDYRDSQRTTTQLQDAAEGRALVDQAKGILMHALGCSADDALARIRDVSQRSSLRATEVAARVIDAHGSSAKSPGGPAVVQPRRRQRRAS